MGSVNKPNKYISYFENPESSKKTPAPPGKAHNFVPDKVRNFSPDENINVNNVPANSPAIFAYESFGQQPQTRSPFKPKLSPEELHKRTEAMRAKQQAFLRQSDDHDVLFEQMLDELNRNRSVKNDLFYSEFNPSSRL